MAPSIGRSIQQGFRYANRALLGMALLAGCWLVISFLWQLALNASGFPTEELQAVDEELRQLATQASAPPAVTPVETLAPSETPAAPEAQPPAESPTVDAGAPAAQAREQSAAEEPSAASELPAQPSEPAPALEEPVDVQIPLAPATPDRAEQRRLAEQERVEILQDWFADAWPGLLAVLLLTVGLGLWLEGGQVGYLGQIAQTGRGSVAEFWRSGLRAFGPLAVTVLFSLLAVLLALLVGALVVALAGALGPVAGAIITLILTVALVGGWLWVMVRTVFWPTAIVVDRLGPVTAFKTTWRSTRGRWWKLAGLGALLLAIFFGVGIVVGILDVIAQAIGGPIGTAIAWAGAILEFAGNIYLGFVSAGAVIRFYLDTKHASAAPVP